MEKSHRIRGLDICENDIVQIISPRSIYRGALGRVLNFRPDDRDECGMLYTLLTADGKLISASGNCLILISTADRDNSKYDHIK